MLADYEPGSSAHPGPMIAKDLLEPLGLAPAELARYIGVDATRLTAILGGEASFDAETAARLARAFELPAERIVLMQVKHDLALLRADADVQSVHILPAPAAVDFPDDDVLRGRLAEAAAEGCGGFSWFFREDVEQEPPVDPYRGLQSLWVGDRLRVYDGNGRPIWTGPILENLDGRMLLPYVRSQTWAEWFYSGLRADLAIGPEHRLFLERLRSS
jgi:addiction module HigA family antidote